MSFNPGGGGGVSSAADVALSNPTNNDAFTYDSATQKWKNAQITKASVGLSSVDNTSDIAKPISSAAQAALNGKQDANQYIGYVYVRPQGDTTSIPPDPVPGMLILNRLS